MSYVKIILIVYAGFCSCYTSRKTGSFLHLSDIQWSNSNITDFTTDSFKESLSTLVSKFEEHPYFVLWSCAGGQHLPKVIRELKKVFKKTTVIPALPPLQLPISNTSHPYYQNMSKYFGNWLDDKAKETFWKAGYYSLSLSTVRNLLVIVLNTAFYCEFHTMNKLDDPAEQWAWLEGELSKARNTSQSVYLVMSVPPTATNDIQYNNTNTMFAHKHFLRYGKVVATFSDVIRGQFGGYEDGDKFNIFYNDKKQACGWLISSPPFYRSARLYLYDKRTVEPINYILYHKSYNRDWRVKYRFIEHFSVSNISVSSFEQILETISNRTDQNYAKFVKDQLNYSKMPRFFNFIQHLIVVVGKWIQETGEALDKAQKDWRPKPKPFWIPAWNYSAECFWPCEALCYCKNVSFTLMGYIDCVDSYRVYENTKDHKQKLEVDYLQGSLSLKANLFIFILSLSIAYLNLHL